MVKCLASALLVAAYSSFLVAQSPVALMSVTQSVRDGNGNPFDSAASGSTLIFDASKNPIKSPEGKQLTLAQFEAAQGAVSSDCIDSGTRTILRFWNLVPHGTYTVGAVFMGAMGEAPAGMGALSDDPKMSAFTADQDGSADLVLNKKSGALSGSGSVTNCLLSGLLDEVMQQPVFQIVGYYHLDNKLDGPAGTSLPQFDFTFPRMMRLNTEIVDRDGKPIADSTPANARIYEFRKRKPVLFPHNGVPMRRHVTVGEFRKAAGSIAAKCTDQGTHVSMSLSGLIPRGVYTVWVAKPDPTDPTHMKMVGVGALGKDDGSQNSFTTDENGEAYITATNPGGRLSTMGTIAACWLTGEPMVQIAGVYHIDGQTHGPVVGPDGTYVGQFAFAYMMPPPASGMKPQ